MLVTETDHCERLQRVYDSIRLNRRDAPRLRKVDRQIDGPVCMPAGDTFAPITYMLNGKQYIVVAIGGPIFRLN